MVGFCTGEPPDYGSLQFFLVMKKQALWESHTATSLGFSLTWKGWKRDKIVTPSYILVMTYLHYTAKGLQTSS